MSLLTTLMNDSLDEGYAQAAVRRGTAGRPEPTRLSGVRLRLAAGAALAALVVTLGAAQTRVTAPEVAEEREELLTRVENRTAETDRLQEEVDALHEEVAARRREALDEGAGKPGALVGLLAGATAVTGPGVKLVVDDAEQAGAGVGGPRDGGYSDAGRVRDRDLQRVVNGLWDAGAEAVSVNGRRLTALSAIRRAGDAVLVNNRPLVPPYTVLAIGDAASVRAAFEDSGDGRHLEELRREYGIRASMTLEEKLRLPAASSLTLRSARPVEQGGVQIQ